MAASSPEQRLHTSRPGLSVPSRLPCSLTILDFVRRRNFTRRSGLLVRSSQ